MSLSRRLGHSSLIAVLQRVLSKAPSISFLPLAGTFLSDWRKSIRLTSLIPLYVRLRMLTSKKTSLKMDSLLHGITFFQCSAYVAFQTIENACHLHGKGILPASVINRRGGIAKWIAWCCRAWCTGILCEFVRLWREAQLEKQKQLKTTTEQVAFDLKWWTEFTVAVCWLPVAVHMSFYPGGIRGMNAGTVAFLSLIASLNNFRSQWRATL